MHVKVFILVCVFLAATGISVTAKAVNVLTANQMADICLDEKGQDAGKEICAAYVRGFIDSTVATDPRVIENVTNDLGESYSQKAARTRVGSRLKNYGPSYYAQFCVQDTVPLEEIAVHVQAALTKERAVDIPARDLVYQVLKKNYPCPQAS